MNQRARGIVTIQDVTVKESERLHESLGYRTPREVYVNEGRQKEGSGTKPEQASLHPMQTLFFVLTMGIGLDLNSFRGDDERS